MILKYQKSMLVKGHSGISVLSKFIEGTLVVRTGHKKSNTYIHQNR